MLVFKYGVYAKNKLGFLKSSLLFNPKHRGLFIFTHVASLEAIILDCVSKLASAVNLTQTWRYLGGETLSWRTAKITLACGHGCEAVLIVNWCRRAQPTVGGATPWQVSLNYLREVTEQATKFSSFVPASVPADGLENVSWNEHLPPQVPLAHSVHQSSRQH